MNNEWNFEPDNYDDCVVNNSVGGKQFTVTWHVDDLKVSHMEKNAIEAFIMDMETEFGKEMPLSISHGKIHNYLRMTLDFSEPGWVMVQMSDYVKMMLHDAPAIMDGKASTPAASHLFKVNLEVPKLLLKEEKEIFMHLVMQSSYLSQRMSCYLDGNFIPMCLAESPRLG